MAGATDKLPQLPEELTPEWFGAVLGHKVKSVENTRNIWGTASKLFYHITYEDESSTADRPADVCVKGVFDPKTIEAQPWTVSLALREADFFSEIAPKIKDVPGATFPKGWWSGKNETQGIAIMDDLTKHGCTFPPEAADYTVDKVMSGVETLAGLHAQYWGQSQEDHPWIWNYDPAMTFMCSQWDTVVRTPGRPELPESLMDGKRVHEAQARYYAERNPKFRTLLHGDTHIGNVYFQEDGRIGFLDWSAFHFGSCFHDVVYFMTALLTVENRRQHEMAILDHYLATLHARGGPKFDRHNDPEVMIEYKRSFMTNIVWLICPYELQTKERVDALCERTVATYLDHQVIETILGQPKPKPAAAA
jgi:hypothetical protein